MEDVTEQLKRNLVVLAIASVVAMVFAQGQAGATQAEDDVAAVVDGAFAAFNDGDIDAFVGHFTDAGLVAFVADPGEPLTPEEARAEIEGFIGLITIELLDVVVESVGQDTATVRLRFDAAGQEVNQTWGLVRSDGGWQVDTVTNEQPEIPAGYEAIPVELFEYGFGFDQSEIQVGDQIAFEATNIGAEPHEIVFVRVPADLDLEAAFGSPDTPEGVVNLAFTFTEPGNSGVAIVEGPIVAGRYVMLCFVADPNGEPHVENGMLADFTVGETAPEPPATGTGVMGADGVSPLKSPAAIALAALFGLVSAAAIGLVVARETSSANSPLE